MKHEQRIVGHFGGWKEAVRQCACGKIWPCIEAFVVEAPKPHLQLHVRTTWAPHSECTRVFYCLSGISLARPDLRTTWDTDLSAVYYVAKRVAKGIWVQESESVDYGTGRLYRLTGQVTTDPLH